MLAQEITHYIKKPQEGDNVVIKLDMAKAYDTVSWAFTCIAMRTMGFGEVFIDLVWRIMSNNWYSVIVNGSRHGFFHSTRGLKQGDPLSPVLFILGAEVLSRMLNLLHQDQNYKGFHMQIGGPQINHLCFADDVIIFTAATRSSLQLIMKTLSTYEAVSDQSINKENSHFMVPTNTPMETIDMSIPIHTMASISPPKTTLNYIKRVTTDFFWGWDKEKKKYHWASWETLSYPYEEGGIGVRKLEDICKALQIKQWWNFRTKNSLWSQFLRDKYCQRSNPIAKKWDTGQSLVWKYMMKNKTIIEPHITWRVHFGNRLFWWDDWLGEGQFAQHDDTINNLNNIIVSYFLQNGHWNETLLRQEAPLHLIPKILNYKIHYQPGMLDEAVWKPTGSGDFSCATAWQICRQKKDSNNINSYIWHKHVPFKISFLVWRALRYKLPTNEKITTFGSSPVNCSCCRRPGKDDINHIFVNGDFAKYIWEWFSAPCGVYHKQTYIKDILYSWWGMENKNDVHKLILQAAPIIVCWNLWKNRCAAKYWSKQSSITRVKFLITKDIYLLINTAYSYIQWPTTWHEMIKIIELCKQDIRIWQISWEKPPQNILKLNTDGSALNNPGKIGGGGILRDHKGELVYAFSIPFGNGSNNQAETLAPSHGIEWCLQHGYKKILLEVDSELLVKWLQLTAKPPWQLQQSIQELINYTRQLDFFSCQHTFREANSTVDFLSKRSHKTDIVQHYYSVQQLPAVVKGSFLLERMGISYFRRKKLKRIKRPP
ncbi:hypothetical protein MTR67_039457 [Solanum verrucosum]|uniref:Reverse transcriptase domain-containing protein n=2 Tax=Solanum verrucosum TaxID=315347 RepID=A0AAF0UH98_SOLVR|nr:hypothetical protein MTR67_039457 [Solanum verrucosum]